MALRVGLSDSGTRPASEPGEQLPWCENDDVLGVEFKQVRVARDKEISAAVAIERDQVVVLGITCDSGNVGGVSPPFGFMLEPPHECLRLPNADPSTEPITGKYGTKLTDQSWTDNDVEWSIREPAVEQGGADTGRDDRRDQHVRVDDDLHRAA